jgi:dGTPase
MLSAQVYDVMQATSQALSGAQPPDVNAVRRHTALVCFSPVMAAQSVAMKSFLLHNLYRHPRVLEKTQAAQQVVRDLFAAYMADPEQMHSAQGMRPTNTKLEREVADYIAGMTDRFAAKEHERLSGQVMFAA